MASTKTLTKTTVFLTRLLAGGGAERQLLLLARGLASCGYDVAIAVFYVDEYVAAKLTLDGVRVLDLGKKGRWDLFGFMWRLIHAVKNERPASLHSYLGMPNIMAIVAKPFLPGTRILWGVRASNMDLLRYDLFSRISYIVECRLARFATCIISNSEAGKRHAISNGMPAHKFVVIPNGIDTTYFHYSHLGRQAIRAEWSLDESIILIGIVARLDPMKDHGFFLRVAAMVAHSCDKARFVCVGGGPADYLAALKKQADQLGLTDKVIWIASREDMPSIYSAFDIACSTSSYGEGFSNSIAEAMACCVPCVATDVGDSSRIIADPACLIQPGNVVNFATVIQHLIDLTPMQRREKGELSREQIVANFCEETLVQRTKITLGLS